MTVDSCLQEVISGVEIRLEDVGVHTVVGVLVLEVVEVLGDVEDAGVSEFKLE